MRFEPGLVPIKLPADEDFSDGTFDCRNGFVAPTVGLGYYQCTSDDGDVSYVISHLLSGYCLPGHFEEEQQAQRMIIALAECGIDWWKPQKALQALPQWHNIRNIYDGIVAGVRSEESASTTDATGGT